MKDITKLKIWPILEKEGFKLKEFRTGSICFGRGAILQPNYKEGFPFMEIRPLLNGHWQVIAEYSDHGKGYEGSPSVISTEFPDIMKEFKELLTNNTNINEIKKNYTKGI
jgi:hypothetical protein